MKFLGILMIIISSTCIGINEANKLKLKCTIVEEIILMIKQIKIQLNYCVPTTREILSKIANQSSFKNLTFIAGCLNDYDDFSFDLLWKNKILLSKLILDNEDIDNLISFGASLGTTDVEGQIELCNTYIDKFQMSLDNYVTQKNKKSKLYVACGVLLGLGASIILI